MQEMWDVNIRYETVLVFNHFVVSKERLFEVLFGCFGCFLKFFDYFTQSGSQLDLSICILQLFMNTGPPDTHESVVGKQFGISASMCMNHF